MRAGYLLTGLPTHTQTREMQGARSAHMHTHRCALPLTEAPGLIAAAVAALVEEEATGAAVDIIVSAVGGCAAVLALQIVDDVECSTQHDNVRVIVGQPQNPEGQDVQPSSDSWTHSTSP